MTHQEITIFDRILKGEIPTKSIYEDDHTFAFADIVPQAPIHVLIIPKTKIINIAHAEDKDVVTLGHILLTAKKVAELLGIHDKGYRLVMNNGHDAGQTVYYLHCHLLGGRALGWPPG